jgi:putative addiction module component (TIGR02574 family)
MHPAVEKLRQLPLQERLQVMEELWDDIQSSDEEWPLLDEQIDEAERRWDELQANPGMALSEEEFWRRMNSPNG